MQQLMGQNGGGNNTGGGNYGGNGGGGGGGQVTTAPTQGQSTPAPTNNANNPAAVLPPCPINAPVAQPSGVQLSTNPLPSSTQPSIAIPTGGVSSSCPGVAAPVAPQAYTVPAGAKHVTSSSELNSALSGGSVDIVLADGTYANSSAFQAGSNRLWAENLGGATLTSGLNFDTSGEAHGLKLDVSGGGALANNGGVVYADGNGLKVYDTWVTGRINQQNISGIRSHGNDSVDIRRVVVKNVTFNGIMLSDDNVNFTPANRSYISDADISYVKDPTPGLLDGTAEAGIWVEHTVTVERVKIRNTGWMGIATEVNTNDSIFRDLDIDDLTGPVGVAIYIEHWTRRALIEKFCFGPNVQEGMQSEWASSAWGSTPAGIDNTVQNGTINTTRDGIFIDVGTANMTVKNVIFKNQSTAAIADLGNNSVISGNDYSGIKSGAVQISNNQPW